MWCCLEISIRRAKPRSGWLDSGGDEGRGKPRKSAGRRMQPWIRGCPNGETHPQPFMGLWMYTGFMPVYANPPKGNILVGGGKEINRDSLSTGEGKGRSPNRISLRRVGRDVGFWICGITSLTTVSRTHLEWWAVEGDSPVG